MNALEFQRAVVGDECGVVVDRSCNGKCACCGECCSDILPLTKSEISKLRNFVRRTNFKATTHICAPSMATYDMTCPFLTKENKCAVYDIRPQVCRLFKCWDYAVGSLEAFESQPKDVQAAFWSLYNQHPVVVSIRKTIFNESVPFDVLAH